MDTFLFIYKYILLFLTCLIDYHLCFVFNNIFFDRRSFMKTNRMVLIPFLAGVIITFCVNLYGNSLLNNLTVILLFGFILIVFKVPVLIV